MTKYQLAVVSINNVDDIMGNWQHIGGTVSQNGKQVGGFLSYKRATNGVPVTASLNVVALSMTIFLDPTTAGGANSVPESITILGCHSDNNGNETGSVSAASHAHAALIGKNFVFDATTNTVSIG